MISENNAQRPASWAPDIVIYHDPCLDGFTAAWAAWLRWPAATFIGSNYGQPAPDVSGKNVLIVDFSYKASALEELRQSAASIVILDHHKTARDDLAPFAFRPNEPELFTLREVTEAIHFLRCNGITPICALFDMDRSGAGMAWDFCFPNQPMPWLVRLVQDRDLWRFAHRPFTGDFGLRLST